MVWWVVKNIWYELKYKRKRWDVCDERWNWKISFKIIKNQIVKMFGRTKIKHRLIFGKS